MESADHIYSHPIVGCVLTFRQHYRIIKITVAQKRRRFNEVL